jgi:hypothetical protein
MNTTSIKIAAVSLALLVLLVGGVAYRSHVWRAGYDQAVSDRKARDLAAVVTRVAENVVVAAKNDSINATITKANDEKLAPVIRTIYVDRVRVGPGTCGPTSATKAPDASGSDRPDPSPRLVSEGTEADIRALTVKVEQAFATGQACQDFGKAHGFMQ